MGSPRPQQGAHSLAALFGVLTLFFLANQVATGLALTIFGLGLSALIGTAYIGKPLPHLPQLDIPGVSDLPVIGPLIFGQDAVVYLSVAVTIAIGWFLSGTRAGLVLRSVGENHEAAHALGYPVRRIRFLAVLFGGAMSGLGGAYLSLAYTPFWSQGMTAGRGWIALALVVFATWKPLRLLLGAYLFGLFSNRAAPCTGFRGADRARIPVDAALPRDDPGACCHLTRRQAHPAQCAGLVG